MDSLWMFLVGWAGLGLVAVLGFARVLKRTTRREDGSTIASVGPPTR
jgi:hypothetical protein